ncbi:MAG: hypothetical protein IJW76_05340 [Clostridia bacterium]|nr:hypothetical protein [Clostridia bacterium]
MKKNSHFYFDFYAAVHNFNFQHFHSVKTLYNFHNFGYSTEKNSFINYLHMKNNNI